jgi:hypothetical protein
MFIAYSAGDYYPIDRLSLDLRHIFMGDITSTEVFRLDSYPELPRFNSASSSDPDSQISDGLSDWSNGYLKGRARAES